MRPNRIGDPPGFVGPDQDRHWGPVQGIEGLSRGLGVVPQVNPSDFGRVGGRAVDAVLLEQGLLEAGNFRIDGGLWQRGRGGEGVGDFVAEVGESLRSKSVFCEALGDVAVEGVAGFLEGKGDVGKGAQVVAAHRGGTKKGAQITGKLGFTAGHGCLRISV